MAVFGVSFRRLRSNGNMLEMLLFDTEEEARQHAKGRVADANTDEVAVWKQIGVPKMETKISWEGETNVQK